MIERYVYLIRHGEPLFSDQAKRYIGQKNPPLSQQGIAQAQALHQKLLPLRPQAVYSSDLLRCIQTAGEISREMAEPIYVPGLREIHMGEWDGQTMGEIRRLYPQEYRDRGRDFAHYRPPGGESFQDCAVRAKTALGNILEECDGDVVVVAHAGVNRTLLCGILGMELRHLFRIEQFFGCVNTLKRKGREWSVVRMNETPC
jgi:probable phosphoglycerate mutase